MAVVVTVCLGPSPALCSLVCHQPHSWALPSLTWQNTPELPDPLPIHHWEGCFGPEQSWPLSRQPVVHLYLRGTALTKTLALFGNSLSFALPNKINLKWLGSSDTFSSKEHAFMWEGMSPGDSVQAVCLEFTSLSSAEHLQCIQRHAPGMKRDLGARFPGNGWKIWGCSAWRRENSGSFWEVSQWAVTMRKVYFGISQRKTETDVEKLQGGKLP